MGPVPAANFDDPNRLVFLRAQDLSATLERPVLEAWIPIRNCPPLAVRLLDLESQELQNRSAAASWNNADAFVSWSKFQKLILVHLVNDLPK